MTLVEAAAGGFAPPFPLSGPDKSLRQSSIYCKEY